MRDKLHYVRGKVNRKNATNGGDLTYGFDRHTIGRGIGSGSGPGKGALNGLGGEEVIIERISHEGDWYGDCWPSGNSVDHPKDGEI